MCSIAERFQNSLLLIATVEIYIKYCCKLSGNSIPLWHSYSPRLHTVQFCTFDNAYEEKLTCTIPVYLHSGHCFYTDCMNTH